MSNVAEAPVPAEDGERWKTLVIVLTLINTVLAAIIAGLQADANIHASQANRDSQYFAVITSQELARQGAQTSYEAGTLSQVFAYDQEALVSQYTALQLEQEGNTANSADFKLQSSVNSARAEAAKKLSIYYTNPRYAPKNAGEFPDLQAYMDDQITAANAIVTDQNASADDYQHWNGKSDSYVSILTILALAFFLLGLGQSLRPGLRLIFAVLGLAVMLIASVWTFYVLVA